MAIFTPRQEAYIKVMETLPSRLKETLKAIEEIQPCTYQQITKHLKTTTNNSTSRTRELKYLGLICTAGTTRVGDNSQDLFRVCTEDEVMRNQKILLEDFTKEKANLENDLERFPTLSEDTKTRLKLRISNLKAKLFRLRKYDPHELKKED